MKPWLGWREASWSAAVPCRFPTARPKAPEDWRTPKAVAPTPPLVAQCLAARGEHGAVWKTEINPESLRDVARLYGLTRQQSNWWRRPGNDTEANKGNKDGTRTNPSSFVPFVSFCSASPSPGQAPKCALPRVTSACAGGGKFGPGEKRSFRLAWLPFPLCLGRASVMQKS